MWGVEELVSGIDRRPEIVTAITNIPKTSLGEMIYIDDGSSKIHSEKSKVVNSGIAKAGINSIALGRPKPIASSRGNTSSG